jgi:hypothetical protein
LAEIACITVRAHFFSQWLPADAVDDLLLTAFRYLATAVAASGRRR